MDRAPDLFEPLSNLTPTSVRWLWPGRFALGKLSVLDGDPGLGKSLVTLDLCARLSTGRELPDGATLWHDAPRRDSRRGASCHNGAPVSLPCNVVVCNAEDAAAPRLTALGGERARLHRSPRPGPLSFALRPRVDFAFLRGQVTMEQVLRHLNLFDRLRGHGQQRRCLCPFHAQPGDKEPTMSIHLGKNLFHCFHAKCAAKGNVLDFWATLHHLPIYEAALHLAATFHVPTNREEARMSTRSTGSSLP